MKISASIGKIYFCSFGVKIETAYDETEFNEAELFERLHRIHPKEFVKIEAGKVAHHFRLLKNYREGIWFYDLYHEDELAASARDKEDFFEFFDSRIRITVAEYAVGKVFLHAGAVGWKGKALVLPSSSFHGKTTLVAELVKKGASYFSDEYAVLDEEGFVHPFPKMLSMRGIIDDVRQVDLPVESFGGKAAEKPLEIGLVLLTQFEKEALWKPEIMSPGEGAMEIISHTISIRYKPEFALKVLNKITNRAIITRTQRGEANIFANLILDFFEKQVID